MHVPPSQLPTEWGGAWTISAAPSSAQGRQDWIRIRNSESFSVQSEFDSFCRSSRKMPGERVHHPIQCQLAVNAPVNTCMQPASQPTNQQPRSRPPLPLRRRRMRMSCMTKRIIRSAEDSSGSEVIQAERGLRGSQGTMWSWFTRSLW